MKKLLLYLPLLSLLIASSCSDEANLRTSIFIPDDEYPDLPAYTEWGYNTFGAYWEREIFRYIDYKIPAKMINTGGRTSFVLNGYKSSYGYYYYYDNADMHEMSLSFNFFSFDPRLFTDLIWLNDMTVDLAGPTVTVEATIDSVEYDLDILSGTIVFRRAQNLLVDKELYEVILSGTFEFQALVEGEPVSVSFGRFDIGMTRDNFYRY